MTPLEIDALLQEIKELIDSIESTEIPSTVESILNNFFFQEDEIEVNYRHKIDNIIEIIKYIQSRIKRRKQRIKGLFKMIEIDSNTARCLEKYLVRHLKAKKIDRLETEKYDLEIVADSSQRDLIINEDIAISDVPEEYQKLSLEIDSFSVRQALESGEELSFAYLSEPELKLKIN